MTRRLESAAFLCWVAFCSAVAAALAYGAAIHDSPGRRIAAALAGVVIGTGIALVSLALVSSLESPPRKQAAVAVHDPPAPAPDAPAVGAWVRREPAVDDLRARLEARLAAGRELREDAPGDRVDEWIESTRQMLENGAPGAARYFAALDRAAWPAHLARLETILRDFL